MEPKSGYTQREKRLLIIAPAILFFVTIIAATAIVLANYSILQPGRASMRTASAAGIMTTHIAFDIMPVKPGGPGSNWPAYIPTTSLTVPANSLVTVSIRNFDLGDATMPANSPLLQVQGTVGGTAILAGQPFAALGPSKVAHTFTIPRLGINVPIPGDASGDQDFAAVTFQIRTGAAGTFHFECLAPCGTGNNGFGGPMASMAYMQGTLTVQ